MDEKEKVYRNVWAKVEGWEGNLHFVIDADILGEDGKLTRNEILRQGRAVDAITSAEIVINEGEGDTATERRFRLTRDDTHWNVTEKGKPDLKVERSKTFDKKTGVINNGPDWSKAVIFTVNQVWPKVSVGAGGSKSRSHEARVASVKALIAQYEGLIAKANAVGAPEIADALKTELDGFNKRLAKLNAPKKTPATAEEAPVAPKIPVGENKADQAIAKSKEARKAAGEGVA